MYSFRMQMIQNIALKYLHMQNIDGLCQSPLPPAVSWEDVRLDVRELESLILHLSKLFLQQKLSRLRNALSHWKIKWELGDCSFLPVPPWHGLDTARGTALELGLPVKSNKQNCTMALSPAFPPPLFAEATIVSISKVSGLEKPGK